MITEQNRKWWVATAGGLSAGLILLDETVVGVALPDMARDLSMSPVAAHWVVSAYLLSFAVLALAGGRIADMYGPRRVFAIGALLFGLASVGCGVASTGTELIAARAVQGVAAAVVFPVAFGIVTAAFPPNERSTALGLMTALAGTMLALGPFIGGAFTTFVSWRLIFFINLPICLVAAWGMVALAAPRPPRAPAPFDIAGLTTLVVGLSFLVFAVMEAPTWPYGRASLVLVFGVGAGFFAAFVFIESRSATPLVDTGLYAVPTIAGAALSFFTGQLAKMVIVVFVPLYLQHSAGLSPLAAGTLMLAAVASTPLLAVPIGRVADRYGARLPILVGTALAAASTALMGIALSSGNLALLILSLLVWGMTLQAALVPAAGAVSRALPHHRQGESGSITVGARNIGSVVGISVASAIYAATGRYDLVIYGLLPLMFVTFLVGAFTLARPRQPM